MPNRNWFWPLCQQCDAAVLNRALYLINANQPVSYPSFGDLPSQQTLQEGGFWQYYILRTLVNHHGWTRHTGKDMVSWWGKCRFPMSGKPETHFRAPS